MFRPHPPTASRLAGLGAAAALAAGLLVTAPGAAHADGSTPTPAPTPTGPVHYSCTGPLGLLKVGVTVDVTNLPDQAPTELPLPQGIRFDISLDFPGNAFAALLSGGLPGLGGLLGGGLGGGLGGSNGLGGVLSGLSLSLGDDDLGVGDLSDTVDDPTTDPVLTTAGSTDGLMLPSPGEYDVTLPDSFTFSPLSFLSLPLFSVTCTQTGTGDGAVDTVDVTKQSSQTTTSLVRTTGAPVVVAKVARQLGEAGRGRVVATVGHRVVGRGTLHHGTARLPLRGAKGSSVTVTYVGNRATKASHDVVRVTR